jgi:hypothetical protein
MLMLILVCAGGYLAARWATNIPILILATVLVGVVAGLAGSLLNIFISDNTITPDQMLISMLMVAAIYSVVATVIGVGAHLLMKWKEEEI